MTKIHRRTFLKAAGALAAIAILKPMKLIDLFDEVAPEAKEAGKFVSMWVKPSDPEAELGADKYFTGHVAMARIYDRVLTPEEILLIYQQDLETFGAESGWRHVTKYYDKGIGTIRIG